MYIGSTDVKGLHHLVYEIIDNAVDEALSGYGNEIEVTIHDDYSISIRDNGRGIPTGMHETGKPTTEVIFTTLHAGGKFGQGGYKSSGGLHGVGAAVVNALSEWLTVTINRGGTIYSQSFSKGGTDLSSLEEKGTTRKTGTTIHFKPYATIFSITIFNCESLIERLRESAFLLENLKIEFIDQRENVKEIFHYDDGITSFIHYLNEGKDGLHDIVSFKGEQE